jgi:hypothetical protein
MDQTGFFRSCEIACQLQYSRGTGCEIPPFQTLAQFPFPLFLIPPNFLRYSFNPNTPLGLVWHQGQVSPGTRLILKPSFDAVTFRLRFYLFKLLTIFKLLVLKLFKSQTASINQKYIVILWLLTSKSFLAFERSKRSHKIQTNRT